MTAAYAYDTNGNRQSLTYENGAVESYAYNLANLVTQVKNRDGQGALLSSYAYTYDLSGNQVGKTDHTGRNTAYTYDGLGRLTDETETLNGQTVFSAAYAYDLRGNRTQLTVGGLESCTTSYTYDLNNRLLTETKNAGAEGELREYHYDANGNTLSVSVGTPAENGQGFAATLTGGGAVAYTYDAFNRMTSVQNGEGIHTYAYRPDGLRQSKTVGGVTTTHIWDGQNIAAEQENGAVTAVYVRGVNLVAREDNTGARQYYLYNAHGDVTQLADGAGNLVRTYDYDAFGNQRALAGDPGTDGNPFRYCGEYWDNETGTYYLRARYYDPAVGRFLSEDTYRGKVKDPLSLNLYTYCGNNPIRYVDKSGNDFRDVMLGMVLAMDKNLTEGLAGWAINKLIGVNVNSPNQYTSAYDFYLGRVIGDVISMAYGIGMSISGIFDILNAIAAGAAVTVGTGGTLLVGVVAVCVEGVAVGSATAALGGAIVLAAAGNYSSDTSAINNIKNNSYYRSGRPSGGNPTEDRLIRKDKAAIKSQDFNDYLKANGENPNKWTKVMETWETPDGVQYERHYWTNGTKSYYHD